MSSRDPLQRSSPIILIANDQEWSARSLESILVAEGYAVERAYTGRQALERAAATLPDLVILDYQLPDLSGADICRQLRADPFFGAATPIFVTTAGANGRSRQLEILESGAWEFFPQPFDGQVMLLKIRTHLAAKAAFEQARRGVLLDSATNLYSPRGVALRARELAADALRNRRGLAVIVLTPDHPALAEAAARVHSAVEDLGASLRGAARQSDAVGHLSGVEFAVLAADTDGEGARRMVERFQEVCRARGGPTLRAAIVAAPNLAEAPGDPLEMLRRAREAAARGSSSGPVELVPPGAPAPSPAAS